MSKTDLSAWLTKPEVAQALGKSEKTVERLERDGKLRKAYRPVPGRKAIPVYHPDNVRRLRQEEAESLAVAERAAAVADVNARDRATGGMRAATDAFAAAASDALTTALDHRLPAVIGGADLVGQGVATTAEAMGRVVNVLEFMCEMLRQQADTNHAIRELVAAQRALPPPAAKLTLTVAEAVDLSGLGLRVIRGLIKDGKLRTFGRGRELRIPRADLEALLGPQEEKQQQPSAAAAG